MSEAWNIRFGTAGTSDSFAAQGYKSSLDVPEYTAKMGLNAFEYQCGRGVRLGLDKAARMAALAAERDILFSVHAPYYISMSSLEEDKRLNSIRYLLQSAAVCRALGGRRIIFHSGSCGKQSREAALEKALDTMRRAVAALDEAGFEDMTLCPETMGKVGQLGTLDEVLAVVFVRTAAQPQRIDVIKYCFVIPSHDRSLPFYCSKKLHRPQGGSNSIPHPLANMCIFADFCQDSLRLSATVPVKKRFSWIVCPNSLVSTGAHRRST